jgi:hypothetical protein
MAMARIYTFIEAESVPSCKETGKYWEYLAESEDEAAEKALYTARLANGQATMGKTGRVVYPSGIDGPYTWVLLGAISQKQFYATKGLPDPNRD